MNLELEKILEQTSYINPSRYISGRIVEYDIKAANINTLYEARAIDDKLYNYLLFLPKKDREVYIGKLIKSDNKYYDCIKNGIISAKKKLIQYNGNIEVPDIVRIANDAVYINKSYDLKNTKFGNIEFKKSNPYSSMIWLQSKGTNLLIFFYYNNNGINIDVKGINTQCQLLHADYMLTFIANVIYNLEKVSLEDALNLVTSFYEDYINMRLPLGYYRELNSMSLYRLKYTDFAVECPGNEPVDINFNLYIIRDLYSILLELYNNRL